MIVLDRLTTGEAAAGRVRESLEGAFAAGGGVRAWCLRIGIGATGRQ